MSGVANTISAAASTLIELIKRPARAVGRFCGRIVDAVSFIKKKIFSDNSCTSPSTPLGQRAASTGPEVSTESDLGSPVHHRVETNIGVIGSRGTCKSTLINALRGLDDDVDGAAATGILLDRQTDTERYQLCGSTFLCELPYVECKHSDAFVHRTGFDHYDALVIVQNDRNVSADILQLTRRAIDRGIPVYIARTMIDVDVETQYRLGAKKAAREMPLCDLCKRCKEAIVKNFRFGIKAENVFLCSNYESLLYDLPDLKRSLLQVKKRPVSDQKG